MEPLSVFVLLLFLSVSNGKVSLYLSSDQTEALYGIKTPGLYYITEGVVNKYAMNFQHQVIPAAVDHIDFTWEAKKGSAVPYKITFMHAPSKAMDNPSVNISTEGIVPTHTDKFRLFFPCTGRVAAQVETLFQVREEVTGVGEGEAAPAKVVPPKSVLLSSIPPSVFVTLGAVTASVLLLTAVLASLYIRRLRKREGALAAHSASLRSSLQLSPEEEYMEKGGGSAGTVVSSSDSYDTLASFTQVPVLGGTGPGRSWAGREYATPIPAEHHWRPGPAESLRTNTSCSPLVTARHTSKPPSLASLHSPHVYDAKLSGRFYGEVTPSRSSQRVRPATGFTNKEVPAYQHYQYTTMAQPGEASPYSVSSELYKHVLPQYFQFNRPKSRGSVLV